MSKLSSILVSASIIAILSACGGGDSKTSASNYQAIIDNPIEYSQTELLAAFEEKVDSEYKGKKQDVNLDIVKAHDIYHLLWGQYSSEIPQVPYTELTNNARAPLQANLAQVITSDIKLNKSLTRSAQTRTSSKVSGTLNCGWSGFIRYTANLDNQGVGTIIYELDQCQTNTSNNINSGRGAISVSLNKFDNFNYVIYFDNLASSIKNYRTGENIHRFSTTGYFQINYVTDEAYPFYPMVDFKQNLLTTINNRQILSQLSSYFESPKGNIYISDIGHVEIKSSLENRSLYNPRSGSITLIGDKSVQFQFEPYWDFAKYLEDTNHDDELDSGVYIDDFRFPLDSQDINDYQLQPIEDLNIPPKVYSPDIPYGKTYYTSTPIQLKSAGNVHDRDTLNEDITISFNWYINGELVKDIHGDTLPAYKAVFGDEIKATLVAFDGLNTVEGPPQYINLLNSPATLTVSNLPTNPNSEEQISFTVDITDPDFLTFDDTPNLNFVMTAAPTGAVMNHQGSVEWTASPEFIFPEQSFNFNFSMLNPAGEISQETHTTSVFIKDDQAMPIARSGIEAPNQNDSIWIGDFTGDGKNEILSTDNNNRVFLISEQTGSYTQSWMYPFKMPTSGSIVQVIGKNIDQNAPLEIIVATETGISLIDDKTKMAKVLLELNDNQAIRKIDIVDLENNGELTLLLLTSNSILKAYRMKDLNTQIFSTNLASASDIAIANVDDDNQLEIITNNGHIYDGKTFSNQWISSTKLGSSMVTTADLDNDGISEIIGADTWGNLSVFSANTKTQLYAFDQFNACNIEATNIDQDAEIEVVLSDCQWGNITAYDWNKAEQTLEEKWLLSVREYDSKSLTFGDSDNDGLQEIHWSALQARIRTNRLIVADLANETATLKTKGSGIQLDKYSTAGWAEVESGNESAVFFIPESNIGFDGSRLAFITPDGNLSISDEISSNWDKSQYAAVTDFNKDGIGDIFLPSTHLDMGAFSAMQLSDMSEIWKINGDSDSNIGIIMAREMNGDEFIDAIYADNKTLNILDIENQLTLVNHTFNYAILDFDIADNGSTPWIIVSENNKTRLMQQNQALLSELSFVDQQCSRVAFFNQDSDSTPEVLCIDSGSQTSSNQIIVYKIENSTLVKYVTYSIGKTIVDLAIDNSTNTNQNFFLLTTDALYYNYDRSSSSRLTKYNAQGLQIWSGPELIGFPSSRSLKHRYSAEKGHQFMLATNQAMYLINQ
ncbi:FG-GAP repeat domain-containing protein [Catenovulum maritimum]|uniref:VCBS repeat-containing protein n=1 Tax=Catenovulum maritimum TaxID=1513271 RepID=A0A0J8GSQ4_9ALTE|nr:VCBS repeat-containing protein [Catenovulum maritimum]KMT65777.1 hypothetical protein XM47_07175 [Catenovulum maritimum]